MPPKKKKQEATKTGEEVSASPSHQVSKLKRKTSVLSPAATQPVAKRRRKAAENVKESPIVKPKRPLKVKIETKTKKVKAEKRQTKSRTSKKATQIKEKLELDSSPPKEKLQIKQEIKSEQVEDENINSNGDQREKMTINVEISDDAMTARKQTRNTVREAVKRDASAGSDAQRKFVGAHVSISGGMYKSVLEADEMGAKAFAIFLKSSRTWESKPLEDKVAQRFKDTLQKYDYSPGMVVPHGSYLLNCGSPNEETLKKSRAMLIDELQRCEMLGLTMFNFHPGSTCGKIPAEKCMDLIAESIDIAHSKSKYVITVIENMSCQGSTIGGKFSELRGIIDRVKDKSRMGVCFDTCHAFAAGYDISTEDGFQKTMTEFDEVIGLKYLKAVHLNDSKGDLGCHQDRHEDIGKGKLGLSSFSRLMNDPRFNDIPMCLETPGGFYDREVKLLYQLCKKPCH